MEEERAKRKIAAEEGGAADDGEGEEAQRS